MIIKKHNIFILSMVILSAVILIVGCAFGNGGKTDTTSPDAESSDTTNDDIMLEEYKEMNAKLKEWFISLINSEETPFSFELNDAKSSTFINKWEKTVTTEENEDKDTVIVARYADKKTGLVFTLEGKIFFNYPGLEYVIYIENTGKEDSPVITCLNSLDVDFQLNPKNGLYDFKTTTGCANMGAGEVGAHLDFSLVTKTGKPNETESFRCTGGRSSSNGWPYFDIYGDQCGLMVAIGWTGQWECALTNNGDSSVNVSAGMQYFASYIKPNEKIRTPSYTLMYYEGEPDYGHNILRRLLLDEYTYEGKTEKVTYLPISAGWNGHGETVSRKDIKRISFNSYPIDNIWVDAGWHGNSTVVDEGNSTCDSWATDVGNWGINPGVFPNGFAPLIELAHENGIKYTVWFELERATIGSEMYNIHRDYYYPLEMSPNVLLNLGNEESYNWMLNYLCDFIDENGIDIYRQDFNIEPLQFWRHADEKDRVGISEINYITNLYRLFDELHERYPDLIIDNCASGGRRLDIEMMKRSISLFRSDYMCGNYSESGFTYPDCSFEAVQMQIQSINYWLPISGSGTPGNTPLYSDSYLFRSLMSSGLCVNLPASDTDKMARKLLNEAAETRKFYCGDFYQLFTPVFDKESIQAYELYRNDLEEGMIMIFCRPECSKKSIVLNLKGLDADDVYVITDADNKEYRYSATGKELEHGFELSDLSPSTARLLYITKQ